jgi:hypothetical protein
MKIWIGALIGVTGIAVGIVGAMYWLAPKKPAAPVAAAVTAPTHAEAVSLAGSTMASLAKAVAAQNLHPFYDATAPAYRSNITWERFNQTFGPYVENHVDLLSVASVPAVLNGEPELFRNGVLHLDGQFPYRQNAPAEFVFEYVHGDAGWQIIGISLQLKQPAA